MTIKRKYKVGIIPNDEQYSAYIEYNLSKNIDDNYILSMSGEISKNKTSFLSLGQNIDEIYELFHDNEIVKEMFDVWKKYHLNDLHPECEHQAVNWDFNKKVLINGHFTQVLQLYPNEHPEGLLMKECEVCGYKLGSSWLFVPIPDDIIEKIKNWPGETL